MDETVERVVSTDIYVCLFLYCLLERRDKSVADFSKFSSNFRIFEL